MADEHPELVVAYMKAMIKVGRWANEHKHAAGAILNRQTFYLDVEDTYQGIKDVDMVPSLSAQNLQCIEIGKDFMVSHGYIKNDFDVDEWARAGVPRAGRDRGARGGVGAAELEQAPRGRRPRGRRHPARLAAESALGNHGSRLKEERCCNVLGRVDYLVVQRPAGKANFSGEMAAELRSLVVRVLDLVILRKEAEGWWMRLSWPTSTRATCVRCARWRPIWRCWSPRRTSTRSSEVAVRPIQPKAVWPHPAKTSLGGNSS